MSFLRHLLAHPLSRRMDIDLPATTEIRRQILEQKPFLRKVYRQWYAMLSASLAENTGTVLELGSGAGFLQDTIQPLVTSEVFFCSHVDVVLNGMQLPLADGSLAAIVMSDVFHHIPDPRRFLQEALRCVRKGGVISMIEPWNTPWSAWVYRRFHHEPFDPQAENWEIHPGGPLSGSNQALPWIIFERDRGQFRQEFPGWELIQARPFMPFSYLLSGGIGLRNLMPGWTFRWWQALEQSRLFTPDRWAMFAHIVLRKLE